MLLCFFPWRHAGKGLGKTPVCQRTDNQSSLSFFRIHTRNYDCPTTYEMNTQTREAIAESNSGYPRSPRDMAVHELFQEQAAVTPDAVAVMFEDQVLSYARLNERANRLAHLLIRRGVTRGNPIGLCMERSPEVVVGLLGILKAGGA